MSDQLKTIRTINPVGRLESFGNPVEPDKRERLRRGFLAFSNFLGLDLTSETQRLVRDWNTRVFASEVETECSRKLDVLTRRLEVSQVNLGQLQAEVDQAEREHFLALSGESEVELATTRQTCLKKKSDLSFLKSETETLSRLRTDAQHAYEAEQDGLYPQFQQDVMRYAVNEQNDAVNTLIRIVEGAEFSHAIRALCQTAFLSEMAGKSVNRFVKNLESVMSTGGLAQPGM